MNSNISQNCFLKIKRSEMLLINVQFVYCMTTSDSILKFSEGSLEEISETTPLSLVSDERATSEQRRAELHETEFRKDPFRGQTHIHKYLLYREMLRKHTCVKEGLRHSRRYMHMLLYEQHAADSRDWLMGLCPPEKQKNKKKHSTSQQHFLDERRQHKIWKNCSWTHLAWMSVACPASAKTWISLTKCITVVLKLNTDISFQTKWCAEAGEIPDMRSADLKWQCGAYFLAQNWTFFGLKPEIWPVGLSL